MSHLMRGPTDTGPTHAKRLLIILVVTASLLALTVGAWLYQAQASSLRERADIELATISSLKTEQIVSWRTQHLKTAQRLTESRLYAEIIADWIADGGEGPTDGIIRRMAAEQPSGDYFDVVLAAPDGSTLLSLAGTPDTPTLDLDIAAEIGAAIDSGSPRLTELHPETDALPAHIHVIAPLFYQEDGVLLSPGAIVLKSSAEDFLYPLIQSWPTPSETAETLLVIRDGGHALLLNDLRHTDGAAHSLRIVLEGSSDPAALALAGHTGVIEGVDYRGERVFAHAAPVPDTEWYMVTKIDSAEALADWRHHAALIITLMTGIVATATGGSLLFWHRERAARLNTILESERARHESDQRLLSLFRAAPLGLGTAIGGRFAEASERFCEMVGRPGGEMTGAPFALVSGDEASVEKAMRVLSNRTGESVETAEITLMRPDGTTIEVLLSSAPIDAADPSRGVSFAALDITARRQAEQLVQEHNALLEALVRISSTRFEDVRGFLRMALTEACRMTGSDRGALYHADPAFTEFTLATAARTTLLADGSLSDTESDPHLDDLSARVLRHQTLVLDEPLHSSSPTPDVDGGQPDTSPAAVGVPIFSEDALIAVAAISGSDVGYDATAANLISVLMDGVWRVIRRHEAEAEVLRINTSLEHIVRERTRDLLDTTIELRQTNRELEEANEAKSRFLRAMSHELRTPLNSIIGFSGIMLDGLAGPLTAEQERQLEMINRSGRHQLALVDDILDLSRIEAGRLDLDLERFDVAVVAREALASVSPAADSKGLAVGLDLPDDGSDTSVFSDQLKVRQILLNLLGNAIKFTDDGAVTVRIGRTSRTLLTLAVDDTGKGIPAEEHDTIFGEFTQRQRSNSTQMEGTGLGLAISRGLASQLGGWITLESTVGRGSCFTLHIPDQR